MQLWRLMAVGVVLAAAGMAVALAAPAPDTAPPKAPELKIDPSKLTPPKVEMPKIVPIVPPPAPPKAPEGTPQEQAWQAATNAMRDEKNTGWSSAEPAASRWKARISTSSRDQP